MKLASQRKKGARWSWVLMIGAALLCWIGTAQGLPTNTTADRLPIANPELCGTRDLTPFERGLDQLRMKSLFSRDPMDTGRRLYAPSCEELCQQCIEIDVYFHLSGLPVDSYNNESDWYIPHPTEQVQLFRQELRNRTNYTVFPEIVPGRFSTVDDIFGLIETQMEFLNHHYQDTPFKFKWINQDPANVTVAVQRDIAYLYAGHLHTANEFATAHHQGDDSRTTLNVYLVYRICGHEFIWTDTTCQTIGAATNPSYQLNDTADGVYLSYDTLIGGGLEYYSNGISLLHEVGHWLGLLHVFQSETSEENGEDPCDPINAERGDYVDDTPFLPQPSVLLYRCSPTYYQDKPIPNSCPNLPGVDPVFNIMNYVGDEDCMNDGHAVFTCGQIERMYQQWMLYRDHNQTCAPNEMLVGMNMNLAGTTDLYVEMAPLDSSDQPIFDLGRDMDLSLFPRHAASGARNFSFCVPAQGDYVLGVTELGRQGFVEGSFLELSVNGALVHRVQGDFGSTECFRFNENGPAAEMRNGVGLDGVFGEPYHYEKAGKDMTVTCSIAADSFYQEPVPIQTSRFMRLDVGLANATDKGMCINDVTKVVLGVDEEHMVQAFPHDTDSSFWTSKVTECRDHSCRITFNLALMEGIYGSENEDGVYNTTCTATVKIGFGEACDEYLKAGNIDCSPNEEQKEVFATAQSQILFYGSGEARAMPFIVSLLMAGVFSLILY